MQRTTMTLGRTLMPEETRVLTDQEQQLVQLALPDGAEEISEGVWNVAESDTEVQVIATADTYVVGVYAVSEEPGEPDVVIEHELLHVAVAAARAAGDALRWAVDEHLADLAS